MRLLKLVPDNTNIDFMRWRNLALVLSTYVRLPSVGPFPVLYEPVWYADKVVAAVAAGVALLAALAGLAAAA